MPQCITRTCEGAKKKKNSIALSSNWTWTSLFSRLTCNTRPLSFSINVYPVLPGCVCPHNPIIPDKIFHYLEYFQMPSWPVMLWVTLHSLRPQYVLFTTDCNIYLQGEILHWGRFSLLVQMVGHFVKLWPVVVSKVWLQWLLWPISLYCWDVKQSQGRVKLRNVPREWIWLIDCHRFPQWTIQPPSSLKWDVYSRMRMLLNVLSYTQYMTTAKSVALLVKFDI